MYAVSCTDIMKGSYNTKTRGESRFEPKCKVRNSPLIGMSCLKSEDLEINGIDDILDSLVIKSNGLKGEGHGLIDCKEFAKPEPETSDFSELEPEPELIDFTDFSNQRRNG